MLAAGWLGAVPRVAVAQPTLSHVTRHAVTPGKTTEITLHGTKLAGALRVWTSFAAQVEIIQAASQKSDASAATCKISLGSGVPIGIQGIAIATADGASDVAYLMIDDLPSVAEDGKNHTVSEAQRVSLPVAIDGQADGTLADYFRFPAKAGERISVEVVATRLGWDFDSLVRVLDASGNELLIEDDDPATGADARFVFTAPRDGDYLLEVRDNRYKPGGRYRLRLGDFPLVSTAAPLVAQRGTPQAVAFRGLLGEATEPLVILPIGQSPAEAVNVSAKPPGRPASGWAMLGLSELPITLEHADVKEPTRLTIPGVACGVLSAPQQRDVFEFAATKGVPLRFRAISRSLGSAAIVALRVLDAAGKQLAESPVTESDEPALNFTPPADGSYKLAIEELAGRGGSEFTYAVECKSGPQFSLLLKNDKNNRLRYSVPSGGAFYLDVQAQRVGYDGPITLAVDSEHPGWQIFNNTIAAKTNEVKLYIQPPLDLAAGELTELRVLGQATAGGRDIKAAMATSVQLRAARPQTPYPPRWHEGMIFVSGLSNKPAFFSVATKSGHVDVQRAATQAKVTLDLERTDPKFKDTPLSVVPVALPGGVTADIKRNGNGPKETYDINLKLPKDLAEGQHTFRYFAYAEMAGQGRGVLSGDIRLNVLPDEKTPSGTEAKTP
jgi:hypothetical protein